ncbi:hypothetical protein AMELA_G00066210 [Ameiurus melas]|uniref:Uncharacterized protein n=1 Tax=Ameiurus melas TaxID=219545 RepID=A0A7J6B385_AMEME|nr:hypothetical protein AMELA_G00066210 [Ameiurus melas]
MASCLYILTTFKLPSFRACTLLLMALLVYDVFFVFITPYITKSGESIMVEVGVGPSDSSTQEKPALLYLVPCTLLFSLLVAVWRSELKPYWKGAVSLPSPVAMAPVTQTLDPPTSESLANQEPDVSDVTNQGEDLPPPTEEERLQKSAGEED